MYKFLVFIFLLQASSSLIAQANAQSPKFEIYRSANIELNEESHKNSDLFAFHQEKVTVKPDLDSETEEGVEEEAETHPIDFKKINLANKVQSTRIMNRDLMQNDESNDQSNGKLDDSKSKFRKFQSMKMINKTKQSISLPGSDSNAANTPNKFNKNQIFDYNYFCQPKHFLAECLRKRLSSKFVMRYRLKNTNTNLNHLINDLTKLNSSLESTEANASSNTTKQSKNVMASLDRTFYNPDLLAQALSTCLLSFEKMCDQQTLNSKD